ncbi:tartrate-resistant acid phosphatase type 5-like [Mercenaria mercenaria]|uniref:tartrate-resistant acid phosphatase type 5-like n=1 Tax=Mercenaria mercenaria TaxID=6596 RepID=UPI00234E5CE2|nr:tartrate-resistant acid phosphatase type 5-like [Mercenaria mercenaria]
MCLMNGGFPLIFVLVLTLKVEGAPLVQNTDSTHDSVRFLVLADWGGRPRYPYKTKVQIDVAQQLAITAERENASFVLSLGDNFYMNGVRNMLSSRFQTTFEDVFYQESLHIPWYFIAGNHDHYGRVLAQIQYSSVSHRWNFPDFYYKITKTLPKDKVLDILLIDTVMLCGQTHATPKGKRVFGPEDIHAAEVQWNWIEQNLKDSTADYLLVGGHYPVYSIGMNGPTECLYTRLEPILYKHRATAYLSGHDHNLQHIQTHKDGKNMDYFISGNGAWSKVLQTNLDAVPEKSLRFFSAEKGVGGFAMFDVSETRMKIKFIDSNGVTRYEHEIKPRKLE